MSDAKLFTPIKVGDVTLEHRVVLAPLTRFRADDKHVPITKLVAEHYAQRATVRGTLLISEATFIAQQAGGYAAVPGIWSQEQIAAWKEVSEDAFTLRVALTRVIYVVFIGCSCSTRAWIIHLLATVGSWSCGIA